MRLPACALLVVALSSPAFALTAEDVPKPPAGSWLSDADGKLRSETIARVSELASALDADGQGQLGVAIVSTTGGAEPRAFATALFNRWGVGHANRNDGVLLMIALGDRKAEIVLGRGVDSGPSRDRTDAIMRDAVVANMKRGDLDAAVREGAEALNGFLRGAPAPARPVATRYVPPTPVESVRWPFYLGGGVGSFVFGGMALRRVLRRRPRRCERCGNDRVLLSEDEEDVHLKPGQQEEEDVGSVDYDVWYCVTCSDTYVRRYAALFTTRSTCGSCSYRTSTSSSVITIPATTYSEGQVQVTTSCSHCGHSSTSYHSTPRITESNDSSSGGSSSSGSFGGGSSDGGGSSGSW